MSSFIVNGKTRTIIARYLAAACNGEFKYPLDLKPKGDLLSVLEKEGCRAEGTGRFSADAIHGVLTDYNYRAFECRYGEKTAETYAPDRVPVKGVRIDKSAATARHWLPNLYTVCRCLRYQMDEGDIPATDFYRAFCGWLDTLAYELAEFAVADERGPLGSRRDWDEF